MLSNWILHRRHIHWGNTCLFLPPTTCFTVTVSAIKDTQFVLLVMPQDTKIVILNRSCLGSKLQPSQWVSDTLPMCHICLVQFLWNWIYSELNIFLAFILLMPFPISKAGKSLSSNPSLKTIPQRMLSSWVLHRKKTYPPGQYKYCKW